MATQPIKTSDIIQENVLQKTIKEFQAWDKVIKIVEGDLKELAKVTKEGINVIDEKDAKSIQELNEKLLELKKQTKALDLAKKESEKASKNIIKLRKEESDAILRGEKVLQAEERTKQQSLRTQDLSAKAIIRERKELERIEKERQKGIKSLNIEDDAYKKLSRERTKAQNEYKRLAIAIGESSQEAQDSLARFNELDEAFTSVNKAVKDGRPFVGRYADAIAEAGIEGNNTTKILIDLKDEQEKLNKVLIRQRKEFGKNSREVKENEDRLQKLDETIKDIEKTSKSSERALNNLTKAVKTLVTATVLLKAFEFVADLFTSSDSGADSFAKTLSRLVITVQVVVGRVVNSFTALKNNFFVAINSIQLTYFEFLDSLNSKPITIFGKEVFSGQVSDVTSEIEKLKKEQLELSKTNTDLTDTFKGLTDEISKKIEANDKAIDQERTNITQIATLNKQASELSKTLENLALIYDDDSQSLSDRNKTITQAITEQEKLNKVTKQSAQLEVDVAKLRAEASTDNAQAQADFIDAQARLIEIETQGLTELNGLRRESNSINRDIRDLELDVLLDNVDNLKTVNERKIADETLAQSQRKNLLDENIKNIEESFKLQGEVVNKELEDLNKIIREKNKGLSEENKKKEKELIDFNELLKLSSEDLAQFLKENGGETQGIRVLEILKERRTALQDVTDTQKELNDSDKEILKTNEDIILQEEALRQLSLEGADSEAILKKLETDRAESKEANLRKEIDLLIEKNKEEGGVSLELIKKQNELNEILLKKKEEDDKKEDKIEDERLKRAKDIQESLTEALGNALDSRFDLIQANLDKEIDASKKQQDRLQDLADKGSADALESLQAEREKEQKLEEEKLKQERKQANIKKGIEVYKILASNDGDVGKTISDVAILEALIKTLPTAYDGMEDTGSGGNLDSKGGFLSVLHPNEAVVKASTNKKKLKAGLTNEQAVEYAIKYQHLKPKMNDKVEVKNDNSELKDIRNILKDLPNNMPTQDLFFDEQEKAYVRIIKQNGKVNRIHTRSKGLFR